MLPYIAYMDPMGHGSIIFPATSTWSIHDDFSPSKLVQLRAPVRAGPTPDVLPPVPDAVPRTFMSLAVSLMGKL